MSFHEDTLRDTRVLDSWLDNVNGVIVEIIVNNAFSDSEIFVSILNDWFLEVSVEFENLYKSNVQISYMYSFDNF